MAVIDKLKKLPDAADVKRILDLERKLAAAQGNLAGLKARYDASENDLAIAQKTIELFTATRGDFEDRQLKNPKHTKDATGTAGIIATDWHAEERVDPKTINYENEFNLEIAERRIERLWDRAILLTESARQLTRIDECFVGLLGDMIGGHIHEELAETNFLSPVKATYWVQNKLYDGLRRIKAHGKFKRVRVLGCSGNHGRDTKKTRVATREAHSYEWLAFQNVADRLSGDKTFEFQIADGVLSYATIENRLVRFTHGDAINFGGGVGGLGIPANKKIQKWDQTRKAYHTYFGHWHQYLRQGNFTACPTLKGYDAFSEWIGAAKEDPAQLFFVFDSQRGLVREEKIFVESA